jgi:hypothetical protein
MHRDNGGASILNRQAIPARYRMEATETLIEDEFRDRHTETGILALCCGASPSTSRQPAIEPLPSATPVSSLGS